MGAAALAICASTAQAQVRVDAGNTGPTFDGTSWSTAYKSLDTAIANNLSGADIWIKAGTYVPTVATNGSDPRTKTFVIPNGWKVLGGFDGTETTPSQRPGNLYSTLSGDLDRDPGDRGDDAYTVLTCEAGDSETTLDSLRIEYGNASGSSSNPEEVNGGGIYAEGVDLEMERVFLSQNWADEKGGGIYVGSDASVFPTVEFLNCVFSDNNADEHGGGAYLFELSKDGDDTEQSNLYNCVFSSNTAGDDDDPALGLGGGGLFVDSQGNRLELMNCQFDNNSVEGLGGAIYLSEESWVQIANSTITDNSATTIDSSSNPVQGGAGIYCEEDCDNSSIQNSIVWGNTGSLNPCDLSGPGAEVSGAGGPYIPVDYTDITYELFPGTTIHPSPSGSTNINSDPDFTTSGGQTYALSASSPCLHAGNGLLILYDWWELDGDTFTSGDPMPFDLNLATRDVGTEVDMGALERQ